MICLIKGLKGRCLDWPSKFWFWTTEIGPFYMNQKRSKRLGGRLQRVSPQRVALERPTPLCPIDQAMGREKWCESSTSSNALGQAAPLLAM